MNTTITNISKKTQIFINSNWSITLFPGVILLMGIFNLISYRYLGVQVTTPWVNSGGVSYGDANDWIGWIAITISSVGGSISVLGTLFVIRFDKRFIIPIVIGDALVITDAIFAGYVFTALSYLLMMSSGIYSWFVWNNQDDESDNKSIMNKTWWFIILGLVLTYITIGVVIVLSFPAFFNNSDDPHNILNWIDIVCSGVVVAAWIVMTRKDKLAFTGFLSTDMLYLITFFIMGYWGTGMSYFVYLFIDSTSMVSWITKE